MGFEFKGRRNTEQRNSHTIQGSRDREETHKTVVFVTHSIPEAAYLSTKIVVLSPRPGKIIDIIEITLPEKRTLDMRDTPEFLALSHRIREGLRAGHSYD